MDIDKLKAAARPGWRAGHHEDKWWSHRFVTIARADIGVEMDISDESIRIHVGDGAGDVSHARMTPTDLRELAAQLLAVADAMEPPRLWADYIDETGPG